MSASKLSHYPAITSASPVAGYTAWYNPTTIQQAASVVTAWNDASVNAYHFSTAHASPVYTASAINGLAGVTCTSALSQYLSGTPTLANLIGTSSTTFTMYAVFSIAAFTGGQATLGSCRGAPPFCDSGGYCEFGVSNVPGSVAGMYAQGTATSSNYYLEQSASTSTTMIVEAYYDGTNIHYRQNGSNSTPNGVTGGLVTTGTIQCGKSWTTDFFSGSICELIFYNTVLSGANMTANRSYLGTKYAGTG